MEENEDIKLHKPHTVEPLSLSSCRMWDSETKPDCHPCSRDIYAYTYFESRWFYSFSAIMKCVIKSKKPFKMVHRYQLSSSWARSTSIKNPSKHYLARSQRATMKKTSISLWKLCRANIWRTRSSFFVFLTSSFVRQANTTEIQSIIICWHITPSLSRWAKSVENPNNYSTIKIKHQIFVRLEST